MNQLFKILQNKANNFNRRPVQIYTDWVFKRLSLSKIKHRGYKDMLRKRRLKIE
jgi:hypothetical protein